MCLWVVVDDAVQKMLAEAVEALITLTGNEEAYRDWARRARRGMNRSFGLLVFFRTTEYLDYRVSMVVNVVFSSNLVFLWKEDDREGGLHVCWLTLPLVRPHVSVVVIVRYHCGGSERDCYPASHLRVR